MADFALLESLKLIFRKIWVLEKFCNFHTVHCVHTCLTMLEMRLRSTRWPSSTSWRLRPPSYRPSNTLPEVGLFEGCYTINHTWPRLLDQHRTIREEKKERTSLERDFGWIEAKRLTSLSFQCRRSVYPGSKSILALTSSKASLAAGSQA